MNARTHDEIDAALKPMINAKLVDLRETHPLLQYVPLDGQPKPPEWVIPGVIGEGLVAISGQQGIGKTTALFPLALIAAGLIESELSPGECWRNVVYASEDTEQVKRIAAGLVRAGLVDPVLMSERVRLVQAVRSDSGYLVSAGQYIAADLTRYVGTEPIKPLVVLDTRSACLSSDDENDNAETSRTVANLKQHFDGLPVWLVGHISKANFGRSDVDAMSTRGASSLEGDVNQTMFLIKEGEDRWLVNGKTRFEARHRELQISGNTEMLVVKNRFGHEEVLALRYGLPVVADVPRAELKAAAKDEAKQQANAALREQILETLRVTQANGDRLNMTGLREATSGKTAAVSAAVADLIKERWIVLVSIPAHLRAEPNKKQFLFALTTEQHDHVIRDGRPMPPEASEIPPSLTKKGVGAVGNGSRSD